MKIWIYRTGTKFDYNDNRSIHFVEQNPDKAWMFTKLYILYDKPCNQGFTELIETSRHIEIPNGWYPEIQPEQLVEFESTTLS